MRRGLQRFEVSRDKMIRSFIIPFTLLPFVLAVVVGLFDEYPPSLIVSLSLVRIIISTVLFLSVVYFLAKQFERQEHFFKFLIISNWLSVNSIILACPILIGLAIGLEPDRFEVYAVFSEIVGYIYCAFVITCCFRLPWEMGGFIAIVGLAINENMFDLSDYIRDMAVTV